MIVDRAETRCLARTSHYEGGNLWSYDIINEKVERLPISKAGYVSVHEGIEDNFVVVHHHHTDHLELTAHNFADPTKPLSKITLVSGQAKAEGDANIWDKLPHAYVAFHQAVGSQAGTCLLQVWPDEIDVQPLTWHAERYDSLAQPILDVIPIPDTDYVVFLIQGDSRPPIYDVKNKRVEAFLPLPAREGGCVRMQMRPGANELWVADGDTIAVINTDSLSLKSEAVVDQRGSLSDFSFVPDSSVVAIARPSEEDVVGLDSKDMTVTRLAYVGGRVNELLVLSNWLVVARDQRKGDLLTGHLDTAWHRKDH